MTLNFEPLIRFMKHLPINGDVELGLLKCHLLIEEVLTKLITRESESPEFIIKARLTFAQKIWLARGLSNLGAEDWVWSSLKKLNEARNELSHGLEPEQINLKLKQFIINVETSQGTPPPEVLGTNMGRFQWAAFKLYSCISTHAHFDPTELKIPTVLGSYIQNK